ncbi:MAG: hypothetical protein ACI4UM_01195 [Succinivibrio sp.]
MLKKNSLLSCVLAGIIASVNQAQSATVYDKDRTSLDIFGSVKSMLATDKAARTLKSSYKKGNNDNTLLNSANLGIAGRARITDGVSAIAYSEWIMPSGYNGFDKIRTKAQYLGVDASEFGTLCAGRGNNAYYAVAGVTDIFEELDTRVNDHYSLGDELPGLFMYSLSALGWDLKLSYQTAAEDINDPPVDIYNGVAFSMTTRLKSGISIAYGISYYDFAYNNDALMTGYFRPIVNRMHYREENDLFAAEVFKPSWKIDKGISVTYGNYGEGLYIAANITQTKYDHFTHHLFSYELASNYTFDSGFYLSAVYGAKRFNNTNIISEVTLGAGYHFAPSFKVFAEGSVDAGSKPLQYYSEQMTKVACLDKNRALLGAVYLY